MLVFVRTRELINASWDEFDFSKSEWVIPAERMKMGKVRVLPLSRQVTEVLRSQAMPMAEEVILVWLKYIDEVLE